MDDSCLRKMIWKIGLIWRGIPFFAKTSTTVALELYWFFEILKAIDEENEVIIGDSMLLGMKSSRVYKFKFDIEEIDDGKHELVI
jgi:hypothetical protein